jgi:transcriptional regulator with XRE-family HTH domain
MNDADPLTLEVVRQLYYVMKELGVSRAELAKRIDVNRASVSFALRTRTGKSLTLRTVYGYAEALGCEVKISITTKEVGSK